MPNKKILYYLNDNLKTNYIRIRVKEGICNHFSINLFSEWMHCGEFSYYENNPNKHLTKLKKEIEKLQNHYDFSEKLSLIKLNKLYDIYNLNINDSDIIDALDGLEWDLHNSDEEHDNKIVQSLIYNDNI